MKADEIAHRAMLNIAREYPVLSEHLDGVAMHASERYIRDAIEGAVTAERERCAKVAERTNSHGRFIAVLIRAGGHTDA